MFRKILDVQRLIVSEDRISNNVKYSLLVQAKNMVRVAQSQTFLDLIFLMQVLLGSGKGILDPQY